MSDKTATSSTKDQRTRFIDAARELGADEDEATFKAKLAVIGRQKPAPLPGKNAPDDLSDESPQKRSKDGSPDR